MKGAPFPGLHAWSASRWLAGPPAARRDECARSFFSIAPSFFAIARSFFEITRRFFPITRVVFANAHLFRVRSVIFLVHSTNLRMRSIFSRAHEIFSRGLSIFSRVRSIFSRVHEIFRRALSKFRRGLSIFFRVHSIFVRASAIFSRLPVLPRPLCRGPPVRRAVRACVCQIPGEDLALARLALVKTSALRMQNRSEEAAILRCTSCLGLGTPGRQEALSNRGLLFCYGKILSPWRQPGRSINFVRTISNARWLRVITEYEYQNEDRKVFVDRIE